MITKDEIVGWVKNHRIAVLYGGISEEREISIRSGKAVSKVLTEINQNTIEIDFNRETIKKLLTEKIDFIFIALHGPYGEDGTVQGMLELLGIPYSGSGVISSALAMNKLYSKKIFKANNIPTPDWIVINHSTKTNDVINFGLPVVVKPISQGSTIGVNIVRNEQDLTSALNVAFKHGDEVLVERYVPGKELSVGIIGEMILPVIEIIPEGEYYDYTAKYTPGKSKHIIPAKLPKNILSKAEKLAMSAFKSLGCKAVGRVDMRYDGKEIYILEVNTIPGMTETSLLPESASHVGLSFKDLVLEIIRYSL